MATIKRIELPHPLANLPERAVPGSGPEPDRPKGKWGPRYPALEWRPMPFMDEYIDELRNSRERSESYVRMMKVGLSRFAAYMADFENVRHPDEITRDNILHYQAYLLNEARKPDGEPLKPAYRQRLMRYMHSWLIWMDEAGYLDGENPWHRIKVGKTEKVPKPLTGDEVALLFEAHRRQVNWMSPFAWHRQEVILTLLYSWGLRIHELATMNVQNVDLRLTTVYAKNKGSTRPKPLNYLPSIKGCVMRYLPHRAREAADGEDALLVEATFGGRLSISRIYTIIKDLGERAGVTINPHRLRDTFGTVMSNGGADLKHVQILMGHSSLKQTQVYVDVMDDPVAASHAKVMGPKLEQLLNGELELPDGVDEPPPGWPRYRTPPQR